MNRTLTNNKKKFNILVIVTITVREIRYLAIYLQCSVVNAKGKNRVAFVINYFISQNISSDPTLK